MWSATGRDFTMSHKHSKSVTASGGAEESVIVNIILHGYWGSHGRTEMYVNEHLALQKLKIFKDSTDAPTANSDQESGKLS